MTDNNTDELDKYGVWVKNSSENTPSKNDEEKDSTVTSELPKLSSEQNSSDEDFELPSFDDISEEPDTIMEDDTALSMEELSKISDTTEILEATDSNENKMNNEEEIEVSLDDFLPDGFSQEATNNTDNDNFSSNTEDISVNESNPSKTEDQIEINSQLSQDNMTEEEEPFDIDLDFEEENPDLSFETDSKDNTNVLANQENSDNTESLIDPMKTEDVDIADFGIDIDNDELPITNTEISGKTQKDTIDYDLSISSDDNNDLSQKGSFDNSNNSIPDTFDEETAFLTDDSHDSSEPHSETMLKTIVDQLSLLKDEISDLKEQFIEMKNNNQTSSTSNTAQAKVNSEEPKEEDTGFFSGSEEDDTIALSGDELDNILNNVNFTGDSNGKKISDSTEKSTNNETISEEEPVVADEPLDISDFDGLTADDNSLTEGPSKEDESPLDETISEEEPVTDDEPLDISDFNDLTADDNSLTEEPSEEDESPLDETISEEEPVVADEPLDISDFDDLTADDNSLTEEPSKEDESPLDETISEEEPVVAENPDEAISLDDMFENDFSKSDNLSEENSKNELDVDFDNESLEEPVLDDVDFNIDNETANKEEEAEISVPKVNDMIIESSNTDLLDSGDINDLSTLPESLQTAVPNDSEINTEEPEYNDENIQDQTENTLTKDNLDYLEQDSEAKKQDLSDTKNTDQTSIPSDLKNDIKSVLSYMDQLLENLPEEKITEFARSEQFNTYKKLFKELGLR